jgi:CubicO group peptidase (beta-lactamase class C family)
MTSWHGFRAEGRVLALGAAALLLPAAASAQSAPPPSAHAERTAARILDELRTASGVPGIGAAVARDGRVVWTGSTGYRDLERKLPVTPDTRFRFASVSKVFAATAAARLRQEGKLDVDAPVASILPYLKNGWPTITSRQLAAHISGIPHYQAVDDNRGGIRYKTPPETVAIFANRELLSPPGTRYTYSSWGYTLLDAVVEANSGTRYLDYVARTLAPGLALGPDATGSADPNASHAYEMQDGAPVEAPPHDYSYSWGGAGLGGTPRALAEWGGRVLRGDVVSAQTLAWMAQPSRLNDGTPVKEADYQLGFGWRTMPDLDGHTLMHHAGITLGARSALILVPEQKIAVSLLANALWVASIERSALTIAAPLRPAPPLAPRACPITAQRYSGSFNGEPVAGTARFAVEDGICSATLSAGNALGKWLENTSKRKTPGVRLIGIDPGSGFARGALITPVGAYELRPTESGFTAAFGATRSLTIKFE